MSRLAAILAVMLVAAALVAPCSAVTYNYSFEDGLQGWVVDGTDQAPVWHIIPSNKLAYAGLWSLECYMVNINDATKIWIERSYDVQSES